MPDKYQSYRFWKIVCSAKTLQIMPVCKRRNFCKHFVFRYYGNLHCEVLGVAGPDMCASLESCPIFSYSTSLFHFRYPLLLSETKWCRFRMSMLICTKENSSSRLFFTWMKCLIFKSATFVYYFYREKSYFDQHENHLDEFIFF